MWYEEHDTKEQRTLTNRKHKQIILIKILKKNNVHGSIVGLYQNSIKKCIGFIFVIR